MQRIAFILYNAYTCGWSKKSIGAHGKPCIGALCPPHPVVKCLLETRKIKKWAYYSANDECVQFVSFVLYDNFYSNSPSILSWLNVE